MRKTGWQKTWVRAVSTILTIAVMAGIFFFSAEDAAASDATSGWFARRMIPLIVHNYEELPPKEQEAVYSEAQTIVRKGAHFLEYFLLGILMLFCMESWRGPGKPERVYAWLAGTVYAGTDELHQLSTLGRSGQCTDVLLDSAGVLTGVLLAGWIVHRSIKQQKGGKDFNADEYRAGSSGNTTEHR